MDELGKQIQAKALDAVIVWDAMVRYYSEYGDEIPIALEKNVISTIDIGVLKFTRHRELAERFVDFVTSEAGQRVLKISLQYQTSGIKVNFGRKYSFNQKTGLK